MNRIISLFLFIFVANCLTAQYNSPIKNKVTLGVQTTADGLIFRGVASIDTVTATSKITRANKQDTSAFILLDTVTNLLWHYKTASNGWSQAGGSTLDTATMLLPYWRSGRFSGVLPVANGGTGATTYTTNQIIKGNGTSAISNSNLFSSGTTLGLNTSTFPDFFPNVLHIQGTANTGLALSSTDGNSFFQFVTLSTPGSRGPIIHNNGFRFAKASGRSAEGYADIMILDTLLRVGINIGNDGNPTETLHVGGNGLFTGNVGIGSATPTTSGSGITFPATQSASINVNTLDDYEEGTFTPTWVSSGATFVYDANYRHGRYTKIGNTVYVSFHISTSEVPGGTITNALTISGLPFNSGNVDYSNMSAFNYGYLYNIDWPASKTQATALMNRNASTVAMYWEQDSTISAQWLASALRAGSYLIINGFYFVP
jgi:hypothetical protein